MAISPRTEPGRPRRIQSSKGRIEVIGAITILLGVLFAGAAWAVLSDRESENEQTLDRISTLEAEQTPEFPVGLISATPTPGGPPTETPVPGSGDQPIVEPIPPTATVTQAPVTATSRADMATNAPLASPTPPQDMPPATHITVPAVGIDADVIQVTPYEAELEGVLVLKWNVADWAAGHHSTSADPGEGGNIVMAGHDDYRGEVFRGLHDAKIGDDIFVDSPAGTFHYIIREIYLRKEKGAPLGERLDIGLFLAQMPEERLTLVTCWPYGVDDHRMIIVAKPADDDV